MVRSKRSRAASTNHQATGTSRTLPRNRFAKKTYQNPARRTTTTNVIPPGPAPTGGSYLSNGTRIISDTESEHLDGNLASESELSDVEQDTQEYLQTTPETDQQMGKADDSISDIDSKLGEGTPDLQCLEVMDETEQDTQDCLQTTPETDQRTGKVDDSISVIDSKLSEGNSDSQCLQVKDETEQDTEELLPTTPEIDQQTSQSDSSVPMCPTSPGRFGLQSQDTFILNPSTCEGCEDDLDPLPTITPMPSMFCDMEPTLSHNTSLLLHRNLTLLIAKRRLVFFQDEERIRQLDADIAKLKGEIRIMKSTFQRLRQKVLHTRRALVASGEHSSVHPKPKLKTWKTV